MAAANNKRIEETATTALKAALLQCPILDSYIDSNDKTPSWDGTVFVYENGKQKKADFIGKVPIQVKGTETCFNGNTASFSCNVADLRNYLKTGGCIFFLISVVPATGAHKIFYTSMIALDLQRILEKAGRQKTFKISLGLFPEGNVDEISHIFLTFAQESPKQISFIGNKLLSLEELQNQGTTIERLSFTAAGVGLNRDNIEKFISTHSFYLYAKPKGLDIEIPVDKIECACVKKKVDGKVCVKDTEYFASYFVVYDHGEPIIKIGKSITMTLNSLRNKGTIMFKPAGTLSDFIKDAEFVLDLMTQKVLSINSGSIMIEDTATPSEELEKYAGSLAYYREVKRMLDILGVSEELQCDQLTLNDEENIRNFVGAVLYNRRIGFPNMKDNVIHGVFRIANLRILIWAERQADGNYTLESFFGHHSVSMFQKEDTERRNPIPTSHFTLLTGQSFVHASNMDYQRIYEDICSIEPSPFYLEQVNFLLLSILQGFDQQAEKDAALLDLATDVCDWLWRFKTDRNENIAALNRLQIVKRQREFTSDEMLELLKILERDRTPEIRCGVYLLLGDTDKAQGYFNELDANAQDEFLAFPICHFGTLEKKR